VWITPTNEVWFTRPSKRGLPDGGSIVWPVGGSVDYPTNEVWFTRPSKRGLPDRRSMVWPVGGNVAGGRKCGLPD